MSKIESIMVPENYKPSEEEAFMNPVMKEYFKLKLLAWKDLLLKEIETAHLYIKNASVSSGCDEIDTAIQDAGVVFYSQSMKRTYGIIEYIDLSLEKIRSNTYGYCLSTQEPISLKRLEARPIALYSIEAQEMIEKSLSIVKSPRRKAFY